MSNSGGVRTLLEPSRVLSMASPAFETVMEGTWRRRQYWWMPPLPQVHPGHMPPPRVGLSLYAALERYDTNYIVTVATALIALTRF